MEPTPALAKALVAAQAELPKVPRDGTNPHFKNRYATLDGLLAKVRPVLNKHGLSLVQLPSASPEGQPTLVTVLLHESGESISAAAPLLLTKQDPQGQGSAITYMRRYALAALLGISDQDDDDGNGARASAPSSLQDKRASGSPPSASQRTGGAEELAGPKQLSDFWLLVDKVAQLDPKQQGLDWWKAIADKAAVREHGKPVARLTEAELATVTVHFQEHYAKLAGAESPSGNGSSASQEAAGAAPADSSAGPDGAGTEANPTTNGQESIPVEDGPADSHFKAPTGPRGSRRKKEAA